MQRDLDRLRFGKDEMVDGTPAFLKFIWLTNKHYEGTFSNVKLSDWWAGGDCEEYKDFRILHMENVIKIVPKNEIANDIMNDIYNRYFRNR